MPNVLLTIFLLQAADPPPIDFDLAKLKPDQKRCAAGAGEIVVCGRDRDESFGAALPDSPEELPKAEIGLFGDVRGAIGVRSNFVGGFPSNRIMATVKVPF